MSQAFVHARPAAELAAALAALGYVEGPPSHIPADILSIDRQLCRQLQCGCGRRGLIWRPYHRGRQYTALACCPHCGLATEV